MPFPNPFDLRHHRFRSGEDLVEQFLSTYGSRKTRRNYRTDLRQFFGEEVTRQVASQVKEDDVSEFLQERVDSLKRATLERKIETIRSFFRWVAGQNLVDELPISEEVDTGDLIDQVLNEARNTTEGEGHSPTAEEPDGKDEDDSGDSGGGPVPMDLEPGSEVDLDRETNSGPEKSSSPDSRSEGGASEAGAGTEPTPDSEDNEAPPSEAPSREEPRSGESSSDRSTGSDSEEEGPPKEASMENQDTREEPVGKEATEKNSADEDSTAEDSDGEDQQGTFDWVVPSGNEQEIDLASGREIALGDLPDVLLGALRKLKESGGPEGLCLRCTNDLKVQIRPRRNEDSLVIEVTIEHRSLRRIFQNGGDPSAEPALRQAILHLADRGWALPQAVYDQVDELPDSAGAEGPFSRKHPRWTQEDADDPMIRMILAGTVTGALAEGFGIGKDEEVFLGD